MSPKPWTKHRRYPIPPISFLLSLSPTPKSQYLKNQSQFDPTPSSKTPTPLSIYLSLSLSARFRGALSPLALAPNQPDALHFLKPQQPGKVRSFTGFSLRPWFWGELIASWCASGSSWAAGIEEDSWVDLGSGDLAGILGGCREKIFISDPLLEII